MGELNFYPSKNLYKRYKKMKEKLKAILRGLVKSVPIGNVLVETIENKKAPTSEDKPHNWLSILAQIGGILIIFYMSYKKELPIEQMLELLRSF